GLFIGNDWSRKLGQLGNQCIFRSEAGGYEYFAARSQIAWLHSARFRYPAIWLQLSTSYIQYPFHRRSANQGHLKLKGLLHCYHLSVLNAVFSRWDNTPYQGEERYAYSMAWDGTA